MTVSGASSLRTISSLPQTSQTPSTLGGCAVRWKLAPQLPQTRRPVIRASITASSISELSAASTSALDNAVKLQEQNRALQEEKQQLEDELDAVQKKLDEETALNDQLLQATQDEQSDAKQELRDKEQELDHTRLAYEALLTAMNCDTHEGNVTFSRAMETVARYQECLSENALAEFEKLQEQ